MKKTSIALSFVFILLSVNHSYGFIENRLQWWQVRLAKLEAERARVESSDLAPSILGVIDRDIDRARAIIDVFEGEMNHDGSLTHRTRLISDADIAAEAREVVPPLCSLRLLEVFVRDPDGDDAMAAAREAIARRIDELALHYLGVRSDELAARIMREDMRAEEWKTLALEVRAGSVIAGRTAFEEQAINGTVAAVSMKLRKKNNTVNGRELRTLAIDAARDYLGDCGEMDRSLDSAALAASWAWKRREALIERDLAALKRIMALPGIPAATPPERLRQFLRTPADLEPVLFRIHDAIAAPAPSPAAASYAHAGGAPLLEIPALPDAAALLEEIAGIRTASLHAITGRENIGLAGDLDVRIRGIIERGTGEAQRVFGREQEKARAIAEKSGPRPVMANEQEFNRARRLFEEQRTVLDECRARTVALAEIVSDAKKMPGVEIAARYRYLLERNHEYLALAADLIAASGPTSRLGGTGEHKRYGLCINGTSELIRSIGSSLRIDTGDRPYLSREEIGAIRALTSEFVASMQRIRGGIRQNIAEYGRARSIAAGAELRGNERLKEKIAQDDVDAQRAHAEDCVALHKQFAYGEEMISRYAERYTTFLKEARACAVSPDLERALGMNSVLAAIGGFDGERLHRERASKQYLRKESAVALARLQTLLRYYKKNGVRLLDAPSQEEIASIESGPGPAPQARIDAWTMNEQNMAEIDAKATQKLSMMLNRKRTARVMQGKAPAPAGETSRTVTIHDPDISFAVPAGWAEETVGYAEAFQGVVKSFSAGAGGPSFKLVRLPMESDDMKEAAETWVRKSGCELVEKRWERTPEDEYLWIIGKDGDRNISETCSLSRDGFTLLITGKTSRDRYPRFRAYLRKIVESIN